MADRVQYPASYVASDKASIAAQANHFRIHKLYLLMLALTSVVGSLAPWTVAGSQRLPMFLSTVLIFLGFVLLLIQRGQRYDKTWFDCRAVAESTKTVTWRYMMRAAPYDEDSDRLRVDEAFLQALREIRNASPCVTRCTAPFADPTLSEITDYMRKVRASTLAERIQAYTDERLDEQKAWYALKAKALHRSGRNWFWCMLGLQVLALVLAIALLAFGPLPSSPVPIITTLAAGALAWSQAKRYDELVDPYSVASKELVSLAALLPNTQDENRFQQLVIQAEEAISREHTMWCARREVTLSPAPGPRGAEKKGT